MRPLLSASERRVAPVCDCSSPSDSGFWRVSVDSAMAHLGSRAFARRLREAAVRCDREEGA